MNEQLFEEERPDQAPSPAQPRPNHERWQPLRSGLLNIFKYDAEEFWFEDGRLLLRGNNGAGKSRILALQLPFLLDGEMASHRVEPDGDQAKRMEWNLLMNRHEQRLGYTWIEFGRRDADGAEHFLTLGCGMHARKGIGIPPHARWFFITKKRVGESLRLISENRVPLNRERLEAALGEEGEVYRTAAEYRKGVDDALFGLGSRYGQLIELLLQLRKPQIMRDFKADDLSRLLSQALQPLSERLIENVSVSFRSLDSDRQQLVDLQDAARSVMVFLQTYQHYVRVAARRRAADIRASHSRFETAQREIKRLADELETLRGAHGVAVTEKASATAALVTMRASERELLASPEMKSADDLRRADEARIERARQAQDGAVMASQLGEALDRARAEKGETEKSAGAARLEAEEREGALRATWHAAAFPDPIPETSAVVQIVMQDRADKVALLREKNAAIDKAAAHRAQEETRFEQRRGDVARCEEDEARANADCEKELTALVAALYAWEQSLEVLQVHGDDWRILLEGWLAAPDGPAPVERRVAAAYEMASQALSDRRNWCQRALEEQVAKRVALEEELTSLRAGRHPEPPVPHTRAAEIRAHQAGAPLWKLCAFRDGVSPEDRAGYEAALEAAGLLDAWVTPEGALIDPLAQDVFFRADSARRTGGLNRVIRPEGEFAVVVEGILGCIGIDGDEGATCIGRDGRWRHGLLHGAWQKPAAQYLGHAAREETRLRMIAEREGELARVEEEIEEIEAKRRHIDEQNAKSAQERDRAPVAGPLQKAGHILEAAALATSAARARLDEVDQALAKSREAETGARALRDRDAADMGLAEWKTQDALSRLESLAGDVRVEAAKLWPAREALRNALLAVERAAARAAEVEQSFAGAMARADEAQRAAAEAEAAYQVLRNTVGASADEVLARLNGVRADIERIAAEEDSAAKRLSNLEVQLGVMAEREARALETRDAHEAERAKAVSRLQTFAEKRLLEEVGANLQPERPELAPNPAVELSRRIEQVLVEVSADDESWKRAQAGIQQHFGELNDQLGMRGYHPQAEIVDEGVFAITCAFHGQAHTMTALRQSLEDEIASREQMLDARERAVIENHLIGEVATELQTLIRAGEDWVRIANDELDRQPASSGIKLHFVWEVDPEAPGDLETARRQLLKMTAAWSPAERDSIGRFLQGRINGERAADPSAPWQEHLRRALDYRAWHRFGIQRFQDGQWKRLTKQTYGTGSGGEKALTLTLPQFAAAAAHYRSAAPFAPRLILLDEVFIGIDAPTRARLMALLHNFDLDFVMTSEREWGCYRTLPALSICQLASRPDSPAVHVTRWLWNGRERLSHPNGNIA